MFKKIIIILLVATTTQNIFAQASNQSEVSVSETTSDFKLNSNQYIRLADSVINFSKKYLGSSYRGGGKGPNSFDCSGFTSFVFNNFGIKLGSSSADQAEHTPTVCESEIQPGDLVFYNGRSRGRRVGHVGLVVAKDDNGNFSFIHSASSVGISISQSTSDYYRRRFVKAGRILAHDSLLARTFKTPSENLAQYTTYTSMASTTPELSTNFKTSIKHKTIPTKYHTVKSGETLSEIAAKYGISVSNLKKNNKLKNDFLALKQRIKITESKKIEVEEKVAIKNTTTTANNNQTVSIQTEKRETPTSETITGETNMREIHTIKKGETLFSISKLYGIKISELEKINQLGKSKIFPGQVLKLTNTPTTEKQLTETKKTDDFKQKQDNKTTASVDPKKTSKQKSKSHIVKKGETLSEIADKYNCTVRDIKTWNTKNNNNINAGEKLNINI